MDPNESFTDDEEYYEPKNEEFSIKKPKSLFQKNEEARLHSRESTPEK